MGWVSSLHHKKKVQSNPLKGERWFHTQSYSFLDAHLWSKINLNLHWRIAKLETGCLEYQVTLKQNSPLIHKVKSVISKPVLYTNGKASLINRPKLDLIWLSMVNKQTNISTQSLFCFWTAIAIWINKATVWRGSFRPHAAKFGPIIKQCFVSWKLVRRWHWKV